MAVLLLNFLDKMLKTMAKTGLGEDDGENNDRDRFDDSQILYSFHHTYSLYFIIHIYTIQFSTNIIIHALYKNI